MMSTEGFNLSVWVWFFVEIAIGLALIGAGATIVRRAHAGAGYALVFAGVLGAATTCCWRVFSVVDDSSLRVDALHDLFDLRVLLLIELLQWIVQWSVIIAALAMLAHQIRKKKNPGPREF